MIEIARFEDITCIKMSLEAEGKPVYWVAACLVDGLLIDTGCSHTARELAAFLEGRQLDLVVNTHFHEDHVGGNRIVRDEFAVPIYAHRDSVPLIATGAKLNPYQEFVWGYPEPVDTMELGAAIDTGRFHFDVMETEGHSIGHVALFEQSRGWLFTGDIFITERPRVIRADEDASGLMRSMRKLASLPSERLVIFTSMGKVIQDGRGALTSCADYLQGTGERVRALDAQGASPQEIREELFGAGSSLAALTNGHFSSDNLVASLLKDTD